MEIKLPEHFPVKVNNRKWFKRITRDTSLVGVECVYMFIFKDQILYIGATKNIYQRCLSHEKISRSYTVVYSKVKGYKKFAVERDLIKEVKPKLNKKTGCRIIDPGDRKMAVTVMVKAKHVDAAKIRLQKIAKNFNNIN